MLKPVPFMKLLPNVVTLVGLIIGVSSIRFALDAAWEKAVYCILIATIIDGLDGRVARMLNATSHFGAELDSLCDFINFGLCPALLLYLWSFQQYEYKVISWASIMLYIVCMAIRLARFNTAIVEIDEKHKTDYRFFTGVPAPAGAILALIPMILDFEVTAFVTEFSIRNYTLCINLYIIIIGLLLASRLPSFSLKGLHIKPEYLSLSMIISAMIIILAVIYPWYALPVAAIFYLLSIPLCMYYAQKI
jgi:CDP-diacylglycerol---serine O-phosphatidyltransferase